MPVKASATGNEQLCRCRIRVLKLAAAASSSVRWDTGEASLFLHCDTRNCRLNRLDVEPGRALIEQGVTKPTAAASFRFNELVEAAWLRG
jgi:hypothetical protein